MFATGWLSRLHKPGGNEQKYPELRAEHFGRKRLSSFRATHVEETVRFGREPREDLTVDSCLRVSQIGHSKAIAVNFGFAKYHKGHCYPVSMPCFEQNTSDGSGFLHSERLTWRKPFGSGGNKAIAVNFGFAKYHKGHCYLRYDDTNPEAEEQIYFDNL
jgi:hypothetical protein